MSTKHGKPLRHMNSDINDPIYYNLTLNRGFTASDNSGFNTPANFTEINTTPLFNDAGEWFISLMRCTIPSGIIPRYIFPIQIGDTQTDINLGYNTFTFRYATAPNVYLDPPNLSDYQQTVSFVSELLNPYPNTGAPNFYPTQPLLSIPKPPSANDGQQDVSGSYYFIYLVQSIVKMFNLTLYSLYAKYRTAMALIGKDIPENTHPYFNYDPVTQLWTFNAESVTFGQDNYPRVEVYVDNLTLANTYVPSMYNVQANLPPSNPKDQVLLSCYDLHNNSSSQVINGTTYTYFTMTADKSAIVGYSAFQKILFEINGDIALKNNEFDSIPLNFQSNTSSSYQKPLVPMLVDIEVDRSQFALNNSFIQFQSSSIEQVRLISLAHKATVQNFNLNIFWLDNYGNRRPLEIPSIGNPLTVKLAFFRKLFRQEQ